MSEEEGRRVDRQCAYIAISAVIVLIIVIKSNVIFTIDVFKE